MGKILDTQNLYRETLNEVTKSVENWQSFLDSSSWNFKIEKEVLPTGKYARMRLKYLKEHIKPLYSILWMDKKLSEHLTEVQETASARVLQIMELKKII